MPVSSTGGAGSRPVPVREGLGGPRFIANGGTVLFLGPPGVCKPHVGDGAGAGGDCRRLRRAVLAGADPGGTAGERRSQRASGGPAHPRRQAVRRARCAFRFVGGDIDGDGADSERVQRPTQRDNCVGWRLGDALVLRDGNADRTMARGICPEACRRLPIF